MAICGLWLRPLPGSTAVPEMEVTLRIPGLSRPCGTSARVVGEAVSIVKATGDEGTYLTRPALSVILDWIQ